MKAKPDMLEILEALEEHATALASKYYLNLHYLAYGETACKLFYDLNMYQSSASVKQRKDFYHNIFFGSFLKSILLKLF